MSQLFLLATPLCWSLLAGTAGAEMTAEELRKKVVEARGGAEAMAKIQGVKIDGSYSTNSRPVSQTVLRQRPHRYVMERDSWRQGREHERVSEGFDGQHAWAFDPTAETPGSQPIDRERDSSLQADARFFDALIELPAKTVKHLVGLEETELGQLWHLRLEPSDAPAEDWLIDPETFLPVALYTHRWDWGRLRELRIYYSDWREVGGVLWPFSVEDEFSSFHRRLRVESIEIDPEFSDGAFSSR